METRKSGNATVVTCDVRLDANTTRDAEAYFADAMKGGVNALICNMSKTEYVSSAGLRLLLSIAKQAKKEGGKFAVCCLTPYVKEIFETAGFLQILALYDTEDEAIRATAQ